MILDTIIYGEVTLWNLVWVIVIFIIATVITQFIQWNLKKSLSDRLPKHELDILMKAVRYIIIVLAILSVLPLLSLDLTGLLVAGGFAGLVIGFASQSVVSNMVSGIFLVIERPIKIGDEIAIESVEGFVEDIRFLSTLVRSYDGIYVRLPNEKVFTSVITNYVEDVARRIKYTIGISYRDDAARASNIIREVLNGYPLALMKPTPHIYVDSLGDSRVDINVYLWAPTSEWFSVKADLLWKIKAALDDAGIEIPFPQHMLWFGQESPEKQSDMKGRFK